MQNKLQAKMLMALMVVLILKTKNMVCPCPLNLTTLLSMAQLEGKKILALKKKYPHLDFTLGSCCTL